MSCIPLSALRTRTAPAVAVVRAQELPGARHAVLPPRSPRAGGVALFRYAHRAPPP